MNTKKTDGTKIINIIDFKLQKLSEQINEFYGTVQSRKLEEEYRKLLREKKREETRNNG